VSAAGSERVATAARDGRPSGLKAILRLGFAAHAQPLSRLFQHLRKTRHDQIKRRQDLERNEALTKKLTIILGGERPVHDSTLEKFIVTADNEEAYKAVANFNPKRENLYIWGASGRGKTMLACAMARKLLWEGHRIEYLKPHQLMLMLRSKDGEAQLRMIREYGQIPVLILDELGRGNDSEFSCTNLRDILDARDFNWLGGAALFSNFSLEELAVKWGEDTIPSRILQNFRIVKIDGENMRLKLRATEIIRPQKPFTERGGDRRTGGRPIPEFGEAVIRQPFA
jgi:DNA replication protein DnaC